MKYQSSRTKQIHNIDFDKKRIKCPECSLSRKKQNSKDLAYYQDSNSAYCFHCNTTFFEYKPYEPKQYKVPEWKNNTKLTDKAVKWFNGRMISQDTLIKMKIYSDNEYMPQFDKEIEVMCFPFFMDGKLRNVKFRGSKKSFKLYSGAELIFYNFDSLKDNKYIVITEGEIDCLTWIENGFNNVVSVPNGANNNLEYLENYIHLFDEIETIFLALDVDTKGIELRDEFIRRLGAEKCRIIAFKECKDSNEYFCKYGGLEFKELINNSQIVKVDGVVYTENIQDQIYDFYTKRVQKGLEINIPEIDKYITWETRRLAVVTGVPGSGKSEFVDYIITRLNLLYGWKCAYFTPENYPLEYHYSKIFEKYIGKEFNQKYANEIEYDMAYEHISNNLFWILNEENLTLESILENAKFLVKTKGIKILVIDPYNKVEHQYNSNMSETQYVSKFLDKLTMFGKINNLLIILVAHPRKIEKGSTPSLYDISGSANFYNKCDYGIIVERELNDKGLMSNEILVYYKKIKFKNLGEQGISELRYNYKNGRFEERKTVDEWDNTNWLIKEHEKQEIEELPF